MHRGRASAVRSAVLLRAADQLPLPRLPGTAYLAGESATCALLQQHFVQRRGRPLRSVKVQAQWAPGRVGFGAGPAAVST